MRASTLWINASGAKAKRIRAIRGNLAVVPLVRLVLIFLPAVSGVPIVNRLWPTAMETLSI